MSALVRGCSFPQDVEADPARTTIAAATQLYLRYDGDIGSGTDNHTVNLGVRVSW